MGTGLPVTLTTTGALPTNVSTGTNYYVIKVSDTTFQFAASLANALAGTAIVLTSSGSGTQTVNPNSFVSASAKLQGSMDGTNWADLPISATGDATKTNTITGVGNFVFYSDIPMNYFRPYYTMTAGGQLHVEQVTKVYPRK